MLLKIREKKLDFDYIKKILDEDRIKLREILIKKTKEIMQEQSDIEKSTDLNEYFIDTYTILWNMKKNCNVDIENLTPEEFKTSFDCFSIKHF